LVIAVVFAGFFALVFAASGCGGKTATPAPTSDEAMADADTSADEPGGISILKKELKKPEE